MNLYNRYTKSKNIFMYKNILKHICIVLICGIMGCHPQKEVKKIDLTELTIADIHKAYQGVYDRQSGKSGCDHYCEVEYGRMGFQSYAYWKFNRRNYPKSL